MDDHERTRRQQGSREEAGGSAHQEEPHESHRRSDQRADSPIGPARLPGRGTRAAALLGRQGAEAIHR
ncbi:hypothetical protein GCM10009530_10630 [Microbispora corallina]